jgi:hypothetical protein
MPKVDELQKYEKLQEQLADLKEGKEVATRKMNVVLDEKQLKAIDDAWAEQQQLRKTTKARTKQQQIDAGYKSKRDVQIEVYEQAIKDMDITAILRKKLDDLELRRTKIYLDSYFNATRDDKTRHQAESIANNDLKRAGMRRYDGVDNAYNSKRDKEIAEGEAALKKMLGIKDADEEDET